jgi:hypothetical protein
LLVRQQRNCDWVAAPRQWNDRHEGGFCVGEVDGAAVHLSKIGMKLSNDGERYVKPILFKSVSGINIVK